MQNSNRLQKVFKNISASFLSYIFLFGVGLIARRLLLESFETELVAYDGLLSDIFSFIALADLGADGLFTYRLFKAFADEDKQELNVLVSMYRKLFFIFGFFVIGLCAILGFLLPVIFKGKIIYWNYFYIMFALYSIAAACSYFFGYWRTILVASQQEYKAIRIETLMSFISLLAKIVILLTTKNYLLYLLFTNTCTIFSGIFVSIVSKKSFSNIQIIKTDLQDFKSKGMLKECKDLFIIKISETITWCSTNLFTTLFVNVEMSAFFYNYSLIGSTLYNLLSKIIKTTTATIADIVYKDDIENTYNYYQIVDLISFFVSSTLFVGFYCVFHSVIILVFGNKYVLPNLFLFLYSLQYYITTRSDFVASFRNCFGEYNKEKKGAIIGLVLCVFFSVVLSRKMGLSGIVIGTISSVFVSWVNRSLIIIKGFFNKSFFKYCLRELKLLVISICEVFLVFKITYLLPEGILSILIKCVICVLLPLIINIIINIKNPVFMKMWEIMKDIVTKLIRKGKYNEQN